MYSDTLDLLIIGLVAVMAATSGLLYMVHTELGPLARLAGHKRLLLATALGSGVLAFAAKLVIIIGVALFPQYVVDPFLDRFELPTQGEIAAVPTEPPGYRWVTLPELPQTTETPYSDPTFVWETLPQQVPAPADNPTTPEKVALGKQLFFDTALSLDRTLSCASCHVIDALAGGDGSPTSLGIDGQRGNRNAPTVWNAAFQDRLFWDGRAASLEEQALGPPVNPVEMGMPSLQAVEERVRSNPEYRPRFAAAFGDDAITSDRIAKAIAAFERTLVTTDTPYDRFVGGDLDALTPQQLRGMGLFQSVGCISCHFGPNFSAASVFDTSQPLRPFPTTPIPDQERYRLTEDTGNAPVITGQGVWRVPSLRNVALTGPWLHNGSVTELEEVVRIMSSAQRGYTGHMLRWSDRDQVLVEQTRRKLREDEVQDIVAFLHALSSDRLKQAAQGR
jgi:cytochrome c peroxidase